MSCSWNSWLFKKVLSFFHSLWHHIQMVTPFSIFFPCHFFVAEFLQLQLVELGFEDIISISCFQKSDIFDSLGCEAYGIFSWIHTNWNVCFPGHFTGKSNFYRNCIENTLNKRQRARFKLYSTFDSIFQLSQANTSTGKLSHSAISESFDWEFVRSSLIRQI